MKNIGLLILLIVFCNKGFSQTAVAGKDTVVKGSIDKNCPGGFESYKAYISKAAHYPAVAFENRITGCVHVAFIIEVDGKLTNVHATLTIGSGMDEEALRVISNSSGWLPSTIDGKNVRTSIEVGVNFDILSSNSAEVDGTIVN